MSLNGFFLVVGALWLAGCGDAGNGGERAAEAPAAADSPAPRRSSDSVQLGLPAPADTTRPPGSIGASITEGEVVAAFIESGGIRLSRDTVSPGEITVVVENRAGAPCSFEITSRFAGRWALGRVAPGGNAQMSMVLATAPYNVFCADESGGGARAARDTVRLIVR